MRVDWHELTAGEALARLDSSEAGLSTDEADRRRARYGPNRLARVESVSASTILVAQFRSVVVMLLIAAAIVALLMGDVLEAVAIGIVLAINASIGFVVELRANRAMDALLRYEAPTATVLRDGTTCALTADALVPGDVIELEEGHAVPADARLLSVSGLRVDEAALTGESQPVTKEVPALGDKDAPLAERRPMVYSGTTVAEGRAVAVVTETGPSTELGRIGTLVAGVESGRTPLEDRLDRLGRRLVWLTLGIAGVVTLIGVIRGAAVGLMIETGIALAIAAVPEGLPAVATIALAVGLRRMARRHALVRRLAAVEALGSTTVVCSDKTGTLTAGHMTATRVAGAWRTLSVTGRGYEPEGVFLDGDSTVDPRSSPWLVRLLEAAARTSRAKVGPGGENEVVGDPTDAALDVLALKGGVEQGRLDELAPRVDELPFDTGLRLSASIHERAAAGSGFVCVKGAPDSVLERSSRWVADDGDRPMDHEARDRFQQQNHELAGAGLRVIAIADGEGRALTDLTFLGLVGIVDPPAPGVEDTVRILRSAGIRTVVITGDQRATAEATALEVGAMDPGDEALEGRRLLSMPDEELARLAPRVAVYSRVSPEDKLRIVTALQAQGEVVTMIGDGVNDAAALKKADVGVAMGGRGTDVAKQAAAIVLTDDRFPTIGVAVEEGRVIFENIRKFVFYLFSCNVAEVAVLLFASLVGAPMPLLPLQILWLNLVTDTFPALALAMEPGDPGVMRRPPRPPRQGIISARFVRALVFYAGLITAASLGAFAWALARPDPTRATTVAFMTLALAQLFHLGNARSREPVLAPSRMFANPWAIAAVPLVVVLQLAAVYWTPLRAVLRTQALDLGEWLVIGAFASVPAVSGQIIRLVRSWRVGPTPDR